MGTLTVKGIAWSYFKYDGKLAFGHGDHAIIQYDDCFYNIVERGRIVFTGFSVVECLEVAHVFVWDYLADRMKPSWLCQEHASHSRSQASHDHETPTQRSPMPLLPRGYRLNPSA